MKTTRWWRDATRVGFTEKIPCPSTIFTQPGLRDTISTQTGLGWKITRSVGTYNLLLIRVKTCITYEARHVRRVSHTRQGVYHIRGKSCIIYESRYVSHTRQGVYHIKCKTCITCTTYNLSLHSSALQKVLKVDGNKQDNFLQQFDF